MKSNKAFSLIELIVIISIMSVLVGVVAPQMLRFVGDNKKRECLVDREGLLAVYERCIYDETLTLDQNSLDEMLAGTSAYLDDATKDEVFSFYKDRTTRTCSNGGHFVGIVNGSVVTLSCDCGTHDDVAVVDFVGVVGTELAEEIDLAITPPTSETPESTSSSEEESEEPSSEESVDEYWPYPDSNVWEGKDHMGSVVSVDVPSGLMTSRGGTQYVIVDADGTGKYDIEYTWRMGPEYVGSDIWENIIIWSGVTITDIESIKTKYGQIDGNKVHYGDIMVYNGVRYIYASLSDRYWKDFPTSTGPWHCGGNWYRVDP